MTEYYHINSIETLPIALSRCEKRIDKGFVEVGQAFKEIWIGKLWKENPENYVNFADYCTRRWNFTRQHVTRLVQQSDIVLSLGPEFEPIGSKLPETVVRELVPLPTTESRKEVMTTVLAGNSNPTYKDVREEVEKKLVEILPETDPKVKKIRDRSIAKAEKHFSKLWADFNNEYSNLPAWQLDEMAIKVIKNH